MTESDYILLVIVLTIWAMREWLHLFWREFKRQRDPFLHAMHDLIDADKRATHRKRRP